ncbi:MAG: AAA family ATPase [Clostridiales bacterium]|jgi:CO dehydrogenase maturation factor|nr:AAA family ATPase [Clostridiales bacterium]
MTRTIAVAGKGGTGKTTVSGLLVHYLSLAGKGPVLAVDADANSNLNEVLGVDVETTLGELREEIAKSEMMSPSPIPAGMSKQDYAEFKFSSALVEMDDYDMLVMGRTQGQGCYCFVNGLLQTQVNKYAGRYSYIVVDNEAGMEHISRGILPEVDVILLISDCSRRGIQAVGRINELIKSLKLQTNQVKLIVNRAPDGELNEGIKAEIERQGLDLLAVIPQDDMVYQYDSKGIPLVKLPEDTPVKVAVREIIKKIKL